MKLRALPLYSLAHFWMDFSCALLLFGRVAPGESAVSAFLLYNFCAFAVQMPLGLLADRLGGKRCFSALGCALAAAAWALGGLPAAVTAGLGNALFHVGGGLYALNSGRGCGPLGVFVSPGAVGIYLGALAPAAVPGPAVWLGLLLLAAAILRWGAGARNADFTPVPAGGRGAAMALLCLFAVVVLRALLGGLFRFPWRGELGLWLALAVAGGKAAGGFLADRLGRRQVAAMSLLLAALCFLGSDYPAPGLLAVFFFNMTMPLTLWGAARILRGAKGLAFGLLTFALFLGTLPLLMGAPLAGGSGGLYAAGAAGSLLLLNLGLREEEYLT